MSNYNTQLQTNNSSLEEIITQLNELPEAGGGNSDEIDSCYLLIRGENVGINMICYTGIDANGCLKYCEKIFTDSSNLVGMHDYSVECVCNSVAYCKMFKLIEQLDSQTTGASIVTTDSYSAAINVSANAGEWARVIFTSKS